MNFLDPCLHFQHHILLILLPLHKVFLVKRSWRFSLEIKTLRGITRWKLYKHLVIYFQALRAGG